MMDLEFVSGVFFDYEIPKEKRYLLKYFKTTLQRAFLQYYFVFGNTTNFSDHTGYFCSDRVLWKFKARYKYLTKAYDQAKKSLTEQGMLTVQQIESGNFPLSINKGKKGGLDESQE